MFPVISIFELTFRNIGSLSDVACYILTAYKPEGKRPLVRPRRRWEDNIKMDLQEVGGGCEDWMELAQDRDRWRALVSTVMNHRFPKMRGIS